MSNIKAEIAPKGLEFKPSEFIVSDKYATILSVVSYPKFIYPGYLSSLTSMSGIKLVIKHIPLPFLILFEKVLYLLRSDLFKGLSDDVQDLIKVVFIDVSQGGFERSFLLF